MKTKNAFTLVELLVVITVISILAGLLLPALRNAVDSARQVSCMSNLHEIGIGLLFYAGSDSRLSPSGRALASI